MEKVIVGNATLYHADCLDVISEIEAVDSVITDPPYNFTGVKGGGLGNKEMYNGNKISDWIDFDVAKFIPEIIEKTDPVNCLFFCSRLGIADYCMEIKRLHLNYDVHFWHKTNAIPFTNGTFKSDIEYIVLVYNEGRKIVKGLPQAEYSKLYQSPLDTSPNKEHTTQKPLPLMGKYVRILSDFGDTVLDPFMGSGSTGVACLKNGRNFIGVELERKYFDIACRRIEDAHNQPDFFIERATIQKQEAFVL